MSDGQLEAISETINRVLDEIQEARNEIRTERDRRRRSTIAGGVAILLVAMLSFWTWHLADEIETDRASENIEQCLARNELRESIREAMSILVTELVNQRTDPDILERAERVNSSIAAKFPTVDC